MRLLKLSIRAMMVVVMVVAIDLAAIRACERAVDGGFHYLAIPGIVLIPSLSLVALAFLHSLMSLIRRGEGSPFSVGYVAFGGLAIIATSGVCLALVDYRYLLELLDRLEPFVSTTVRIDEPRPQHAILEAILGEILLPLGIAAPQIAVGMVGGWLASRWDITLISRSRPRALARHQGPPAQEKDLVG